MNNLMRFSVLALVTVLFLMAAAESSGAWGFCDRSFVFMGKTAGDSCTVAYMEVGYGDCERWVVHYLVLRPGGHISERRSQTIDPPAVPVWDRTLVVGDTLEWIQRFWPVDSGFVIDYSGNYRVQEPEYDSAFTKLWNDSLHSGAAPRLVEAGFDEPTFSTDVELVWHHSGGLYKNYLIAEAIKTGSYIFIRTHQPLKGLYSSYHGLLLYRIR